MEKSRKTLKVGLEAGRDPIRRTMHVLTWMADQEGTGHGVREIAVNLGMQPSTISRLMAQLADMSLVSRDVETGRYSLGLELIRLGTIAARKVDVAERARPYLVELSERSGESSYLGVYDASGRRMMRVDSVASSNPLQYVVAINKWVDVLRGASGKAILAYLPEDEVQSILAAEPSAAEGWPQMKDELAAIRADGFACTRSERTPGAVGVAAPIFDARGRVFGDIFITIPESRFDPEREQELGRLVRQAADSTTAAMGGSRKF